MLTRVAVRTVYGEGGIVRLQVEGGLFVLELSTQAEARGSVMSDAEKPSRGVGGFLRRCCEQLAKDAGYSARGQAAEKNSEPHGSDNRQGEGPTEASPHRSSTDPRR